MCDRSVPAATNRQNRRNVADVDTGLSPGPTELLGYASDDFTAFDFNPPTASVITESTMPSLDDRYQKCREDLKLRGQEHVLVWWDDLDNDARAHLLDHIESIPWPLVDKLIETHVLNKPEDAVPTDLEPAPCYPRIPAPDQEDLYQQAKSHGADLIAAGRVAAFTVAGGQGTRLGFDGPKGAVTVTPVREKSLFQVFAETIGATREKYSAQIPWYIMTNPGNHQQTVGFLQDHEFFGLPHGDVMLFMQGMLPSFDFDGKLLMTDKHHLALSPDGHGGSLKALATSGALRDMQARGIEIVSYFQVDNPLVRPFDPLFIGLHRMTESEMSSKVASKVDDLERVGNVCLSDGRLTVVEYSNFPEHLARAKNPDGTRKYDLGSLAMHLLDVKFIDRIVGREFELPFHRAEKVVTSINDHGVAHTPDTPNAVKLEAFIFDALPLAENPLILEIDRSDEFSPVKNATGTDSLETAGRDQIRRAARWLEAAGLSVPRDADGEPNVTIEIAPSYATCVEDVQRRVTRPPKLHPGETIYIS